MAQRAIFLLVILAALSLPATAAGEAGDSPGRTVRAVLSEAALFKNGLAFDVFEIEVPGPGCYQVEGLPEAVHGTFWVAGDSPALVLEQVRCTEVAVRVPSPATGMVGLLLANQNRRVEVNVRGEGWMVGEVRLIGAEPPDIRENTFSAENMLSGRPPGPRLPAAGAAPGSQLFILKTEKGETAFRCEDVQGIHLPGGTLETGGFTEERRRCLAFSVSAGQGKIRVCALARGLTWAPSYRVEKRADDTAEITCRAAVLDDAFDLEGAALRFIAGYPNVRFEGAVDPLSALAGIPDFLRSLSSAGESAFGRRSPVVAQQMVTSNVWAPSESDALAGAAEAGGEQAVEDLYLFPAVKLTMKKGGRAEAPLFRLAVPCRDVYVWDLDAGEADPGWRNASRPGEGAREEVVWHSLRLTNAGKAPWTTAPVMITRGSDLLGQDMLGFTPPGAKTLLKVTRSLGILARRSELEETRRRSAPTEYSGEWDVVVVKSELTVANTKNKAVDVLVKKELAGEVVGSQPTAEVRVLASGLTQVNPKAALSWELTLQPGETKKIVFRHRVLVPVR